MEQNKGFKVVLVGDTSVGKSSIVHQFLFGTFTFYNPGPTIGAAYSTKNVQIKDKKITIRIWDTAGQEKYRSLSRIYYKSSYACLCVFSVMDLDSFNNINSWIDEYEKNNIGNNYVIYLIANKTDFPKNEWSISPKQIEKFAKNKNLPLYFTSCVTGENINNCFEDITKDVLLIYPEIYTNNQSFHISNNVEIDNTKKSKFSKCMC